MAGSTKRARRRRSLALRARSVPGPFSGGSSKPGASSPRLESSLPRIVSPGRRFAECGFSCDDCQSGGYPVIAVTTCRNLLSAALLASLLLAVSPPAAGEPHPWIAAQPDAPADPKALPYYLARPIRQGSEVEFLGEIDFGAAEELRRALALAPSAKVLHLNSPGGEIQEAREMAQIVHERGIITTVDKLCMSACPLVFLAGKQRYVAPGAEIGFHRFESPGMSTAEMDTLNQVDRNYMQKAGIPREFIDKAFATPISSIWIPTHAELQTAGIITGVTSKYLIAVGAYRSYLGERAEAIELILDTIKIRYPDRYPTVHARLYRALKSGNDDIGVAAGDNSTLGDF